MTIAWTATLAFGCAPPRAAARRCAPPCATVRLTLVHCHTCTASRSSAFPLSAPGGYFKHDVRTQGKFLYLAPYGAYTLITPLTARCSNTRYYARFAYSLVRLQTELSAAVQDHARLPTSRTATEHRCAPSCAAVRRTIIRRRTPPGTIRYRVVRPRAPSCAAARRHARTVSERRCAPSCAATYHHPPPHAAGTIMCRAARPRAPSCTAVRRRAPPLFPHCGICDVQSHARYYAKHNN
jgi:hypothetical protein